MQNNFIKLHKALFSTLLITLLATYLLIIQVSTPRFEGEIKLIDCIGEGGMALVTLLWIIATLLARPKGKVTSLLFFGLLAMHLTMLLDFLDEFYIFNTQGDWYLNFEAFPAVIGMCLMSLAIHYWYQEQQLLNQMLVKKERFYRENGSTDFITGLYRADYMKQQICDELKAHGETGLEFCVALIDIKHFSKFNAKYGSVKANSLLADVGQIILLNLRDFDLACRYAGDRFIILLPQTNLCDAKTVIQRVANMVSQHTPYNNKHAINGFTDIHWHCAQAKQTDTLTSLLERLNNELLTCKAA